MLKRDNGGGSIRKRPDGRWEARITVGFDEITGKAIVKSFYGRTKKEAQQKMLARQIDMVQSGRTHLRRVDASMTIGEWLDVWLSSYLINNKPNTLIVYEMAIRVQIKPRIGTTRLTDLSSLDIQRFYNGLFKNGLSPQYINIIHVCLHSSLQKAVDAGYIFKNPAAGCIVPRKQKKKIEPLEPEQQKKLVEAARGTPLEVLVVVALWTGMRKSELLGLTWECVDFDNGEITVSQQLLNTHAEDGAYSLGTTKNGKERVIAPAPFVFQELKRQKAMQAKNRLASGQREASIANFVFTMSDGFSFITQQRAADMFNAIVKKSGIGKCRFHDLRHTFAVNSLRAGDDIKTLQENLGHHSSAFTLDNYGHVTTTMKKDSANRMQRFFESM